MEEPFNASISSITKKATHRSRRAAREVTEPIRAVREDVLEAAGLKLHQRKSAAQPRRCEAERAATSAMLGREAMPRYQCCFLDESAEIVRIEVLDSCDDRDACREAMTLMARIGRFCGFELWDDGRKVDVYRPIKIGAAP